jgi:hypothetical protein
METAGIEPTPGGAKPSAESRPYLATARNDEESLFRRVPCHPVLSHPVLQAPATDVQHGGTLRLGAVVLMRAHFDMVRGTQACPGEKQAGCARQPWAWSTRHYEMSPSVEERFHSALAESA